MRRTTLLWLALMLLVLAPRALATPTPTTLAVSYFDNNSGDAALDPLARGLADMLITDLGKLSELQLVERDKLNAILAELDLSKSKFIDPKTAVKLGKGLSAAYILTGGYLLVGDTMRIDVRIFAVESGKIVASDKIEGARDDFFALEKDLVDVLVKAIDVKLESKERTALRKNATESYDAFLHYSVGLTARDRGDDDAARAAFQAALLADPNYQAAKDALGRLKAVIAVVDDAAAKAWVKDRAALDPKATDFVLRLQLLLSSQTDDPVGLGRKLEVLQWVEKNNLEPRAPGASPIPIYVLGFASRFLEDPRMEAAIAGACEYFIGAYPGEVYPAQQCKTFVQVMETLGKATTPEDRIARITRDAQETLAKAPADSWMRALIIHGDAMRGLIRAYAAKVPKHK